MQLYRNIRFFDYCSYSLLDISIFEFFPLWERSEQMMKFIFENVNTALQTATPIIPLTAPGHVLRETKPIEAHETNPRLASLVHFKALGSLYRSVDPKCAGIISLSTAEVIAAGEEAARIHFV